MHYFIGPLLAEAVVSAIASDDFNDKLGAFVVLTAVGFMCTNAVIKTLSLFI